MNFYLLGMPRCRSLWLSHLLSFGNSYCFHEALSQRDSLLSRRIPNIFGYENVGSADTCPLTFDHKLVSDSPLVIIDRPLGDIKFSLSKSFNFTQEMDVNRQLEKSYDHLQTIHTDNTMRVEFDKLSDTNVAKTIMEFCGVRPDTHHINKMLGSNIVVTNSSLENSNHYFNESQ